MLSFNALLEGFRMFKRHLRLKGKKFNRLGTNADEISNNIIKKLWNGSFFETDLGNYKCFYARDFGMMIDSLIELGYKKECEKTIKYALQQYEKYGGIKTFITKKGKSVNFPNVYSPDSTAYIIRSLRVLNNQKLILRFKEFIQDEVHKFYNIVVEKNTGLVKEKHFGGMRDHSKRKSSCYDTVMCAVVQREANILGLKNPLEKFDYKKILKIVYWNEKYFRNDTSSNLLTSDANIYPFWHGIINDKKMLKKTIKEIKKRNLEKPFPIKYECSRNKNEKRIFLEFLVKDWQTSAIWPMSGLPFIEILSEINKEEARKNLIKYTSLIEKYGTFLEVYNEEGNPYSSKFFSAGEGMIWSALYLKLKKKLQV